MPESIKPRYNPAIHGRRSIRLKGYDYAWHGDYFITICTQNRENFFGKIEDNEMLLNEAGRMIDKWWQKTLDKFRETGIGEYIIMPNHFHAIVQIKDIIPEGADPRVCPDISIREEPGQAHWPGQTRESAPATGDGVPLGTIIQWFKTMTTNEYIRNVKQNDWPAFDKKLWQRNYFEHIIRNENSYNFISNYIKNNPASWAEDSLFSSSKKYVLNKNTTAK